MQKTKIIIFSSNFLPDQSAGALRANEIVNKLIKRNLNLEIVVLTTIPKRYGMNFSKQYYNYKTLENNNNKLIIKRFWIPYFGNSLYATTISYIFYFVQALSYGLIYRPNIILGTSAKLLTSFLATCTAKIANSRLFIDYRDTFIDNYFYFYRQKKKILLLTFLIFIENFVFKNADSINLVSKGFADALEVINKVKKENCKITFFPNSIEQKYKHKILSSTKNKKHKQKSKNSYIAGYFGNLGEGQDILNLLKNLAKNQKALKTLKDKEIRINIYGSGSQLRKIINLLEEDKNTNKKFKISDHVFYKGLILKDKIHLEYKKLDCLFLQLSKIKSLEMVIPTKLFDYSATNLPLVYGASGFTKDFIKNIDGSIYFEQLNPISFVNAIKNSSKINVEKINRNNFLSTYDSDVIYSKYIEHLIRESKLI